MLAKFNIILRRFQRTIVQNSLVRGIKILRIEELKYFPNLFQKNSSENEEAYGEDNTSDQCA